MSYNDWENCICRLPEVWSNVKKRRNLKFGNLDRNLCIAPSGWGRVGSGNWRARAHDRSFERVLRGELLVRDRGTWCATVLVRRHRKFRRCRVDRRGIAGCNVQWTVARVATSIVAHVGPILSSVSSPSLPRPAHALRAPAQQQPSQRLYCWPTYSTMLRVNPPSP